MAAYVAAVSAIVHAASGNATVVLPSGGDDAPAANDIIWIIAVSGDNVSHTNSGYTLLYETNNGTTFKRSIWWKRAAGGDSNPTVGHTSGSTIAAQAIVVRGAVTSGNPYSTSSESNNASSTSITHATITPNNGELILMLSASGNTDTSTSITYSAPSGTNPTFSYNTGFTNQFGDGTTEIGLFAGFGASANGAATGSRTLTQDTARVNNGTLISVASDLSWSGPVIQDRGVEASGIGNISPAWPPHDINDIGLLLIESPGGQAANLGTPAGFVAVTNSPQATGATTAGTQLSIYWARATSNAMSAPTVTDPGDHAYGVIITIRGAINSGNPWDLTAGSVKASANTTTTFDTITTNRANELILFIASRDTDSAAAAWSALTGGNIASKGEFHDSGTTQGNGGGIVVNVSQLAAAGATGAPTQTVASSINAEMTIAIMSQPFTRNLNLNQAINRSNTY